MWKTKSLISSSMFIALLGACGGSSSNTPEPAPPVAVESTANTPQEAPMAATPESGDQGMMCPFADSNVEVAVEDVEGGAALTFTADTANGGTQEQVEFLREWAEERAVDANGHMGMQDMRAEGQDMHDQGMHGQGMHQDGAMQDQGIMMIPPAETTTTDVPDGVVLTIKAKRPEDVGELREQISEHADMIREGSCPMLQAAPMVEEPVEPTPMEEDPMAPMEEDPMDPVPEV